MIDIARDNHIDENEPQPSTAVRDDREGLAAPQEDTLPWESLSDPEEVESAPDPQEPPEVAGQPGETKPLWQTRDAGVAELPGPVAADPTVRSAPETRPWSKPTKRTALRSVRKKERTGSHRQKLVTCLIPVLVIALVVALKHPLGARPAATSDGGPAAQVTGPVSPDIQIAWAIPALYDPAGRDPMKGTTPPVVAVEDNGTAVAATGPLVELVVTGILYSPDNPAALIDTQIVHEGGQIAGATVEKIEKDAVQFEKNGRRWKQTVTQP